MKDDRLSDDEAIELLGKFPGDDEDEDIDGDDGSQILDDDDDGEVVEEEVAEEEVAEEEAEETEEVAEETPPVAEEEEKPTQQPPKDDNPVVPRARLNKEIEKRRALEERIRQLESAAQQPVVQQVAQQNVEIDRAKVAEALNKVLDGEIDGAAEALSAVMSQLSPKQQTTVTPDQIAKAVQAELEATKLRTRADEIIADNAWLDDMNEDHFDADAAEEVIALRDTYIQRGLKPVDALEKAVRVASREYGYEKAEVVPEVKPAATKLKPANIEKKMEVAKKAPKRIPETSDRQQQRERVNLNMISDTDFDNMSIDAIRRARGDIV